MATCIASLSLSGGGELSAAVSVTDIEIGDYDEKMNVGAYQSITATVVPSDAADTVITYRSSDTSVAKVSSTGEIKGIAKGKAVIYVTAEDLTKELPIEVNVATTGININSTYIVLKSGETYRLTASAVPEEACHNITYKVADKNVAGISEAGVINALAVGNTTIFVSNGDYQTAVTVIVNEDSSIYKNKDNDEESDVQNQETEYDYQVNADNTKMITAEKLYNLYSDKSALNINGNGYKIVIDGKNIVNYNNEILTDIDLKRDKDKITFIINDANPLCGDIMLCFEEEYGKYVYLYNESKEKYELLDVNGNQELVISSAGKYMITDKKISAGIGWIVYALVAGAIIMVAGCVAYIIVKRRYWFW